MKFFKQTMKTVPLGGATVLLRADYNVPLEKDGQIADDFRIRASLPTIRYLLKENCKVVIISHLGRPGGRDKAFSLENVATRLSELLGQPVQFVGETTGDKVRMSIKKAPKRSVILLENLRYHEGEEANDAGFAKVLAGDSGARYFVQDGFGVVHRAHASTDAITHFLPSVAGLLLEKEYTTITKAMKHPDRPLLAILGGAKVSDKITIIDEFVKVADKIIITGAMANNFLAYKGANMGKSKVEPDEEEIIKNIYAAVAEKVGEENTDQFLILPTDLAVARAMDDKEERRVKPWYGLASTDMALDMGDETIKRFVGEVEAARTVVWNGTLGVAELSNFSHGSARVALALATHPEIESIIGGGDTADFVIHWDARHGESFSHVSTGGGASLELMAGESLPGVESLLDAPG